MGKMKLELGKGPQGTLPSSAGPGEGQGHVFPGGESWMPWGGWVLTFPFNSKGFFLHPWGGKLPQQPWFPQHPAAALSLLVLSPRRAAVLEQPQPSPPPPHPPLGEGTHVLTGTRLVPPLPCR